jgi:RNA-binding protein Nova
MQASEKKNMATRKSNEPKRIAIKFLLSNSLAGSLIGTKGAAIKELIEVTEAKVTVSTLSDVFPGTSERVILVAGPANSVELAQTLIWDMMALNAKADGDKSVTWSPQAAIDNPGDYDNVMLSGKVTIPATAGGLILGRGGSNLKSIAEESGAHVQLTSKEEAIFTHERVMTINGKTSECAKCVTLLLSKLQEDPEAAQYVNRSVTYVSQMGGGMMGMSSPDYRSSGSGRGPGGPRRSGGGGAPGIKSAGVPGLEEATTVITLNVPDSLVGAIVGRNGSTMREIMGISGAKVELSARGEFAEGTRNRIVTITGVPSCAQVAHMFITQKIEQQASAPPSMRRGPRRSAPRGGSGGGAAGEEDAGEDFNGDGDDNEGDGGVNEEENL